MEAISEGGFPKLLSANLSSAANEAAARLGDFLTSNEKCIAIDVECKAHLAQGDLAALAKLIGLVVSYETKPRDAGYVARIVRLTANHAIACLSQVEGVLNQQERPLAMAIAGHEALWTAE